MKNCIIKGLCVFFMLLSLTFVILPLCASAQSGHGGRTEVIARIEPPSSQISEESPPESSLASQPESQTESQADDTVETGERTLLLILLLAGAAFSSAALVAVTHREGGVTHHS